jgi:transcriptional regulator with XRE-family HTH domain
MDIKGGSSTNNTAFGTNLKRIRKATGKSAKDFAESVGLNYPTYVAYENGRREPQYSTLCEIAAKLEVTPNDLLGFTDGGKTLTQQEKAAQILGYSYKKVKQGEALKYFVVFDSQMIDSDYSRGNSFWRNSLKRARKKGRITEKDGADYMVMTEDEFNDFIEYACNIARENRFEALIAEFYRLT